MQFMKKKMAIWFMIGGLILLIGSIGWLAYTAEGSKFLYGGAIIIIIGAVMTLFKDIGSSESTKELKEAAKKTHAKLVELEGQNEGLKSQNDGLYTKQDELLSKIDRQETTIDKFRAENNDLSSKLSGQVLKNYNFASGGDEIDENFPYLTFMEMGGSEIHVTLYSGEKYPLSDLKIQIQDFPLAPTEEEIIKRLDNHEPMNPSVKKYFFNVGRIPADKVMDLGTFIASNTEKHIFTVQFVAINGSWRQEYSADRSRKTFLPSRGHITSKLFMLPHNDINGILIAEYDSEKDGIGMVLKKVKKENPEVVKPK